MARKLCVALQTPYIELVVASEDASENVANILVGFKRFPLKEAQEQMKIYDGITNKDIPDDVKSKELEAFVKSHILYIKNAKVEIYNNDELVQTVNITDTRNPPELKDFWASGEECLSVLIDNYFDSAPWKSPLYKAHSKALLNVDYEKESRKNF